MLIGSVLESTKPGASNGGSNIEIRPIEADLVSFEVARLPEKSKNSKMGQNAHEN